MNDSSFTGGSANISGILFQVLWSVLRALRVRLNAPIDAEVLPDALLIFEPRDGGDLQLHGGVTEVDQVKAKADHGTWSLQTTICDVLPDLFKAVPGDGSPARRFRFVTEGTMGRWSEAYRFFRRLGSARRPTTNVLAGLDDVRSIGFQRSPSITGFFPELSYTERTLFLRIAAELKTHASIPAACGIRQRS